ncbi:MAG: hypothetical protein FJ125_03375, partial [Deltaproteobacteria bacterium]|nr:hypothetical protein [Deltaproteobacteria bacterium]
MGGPLEWFRVGGWAMYAILAMDLGLIVLVLASLATAGFMRARGKAQCHLLKEILPVFRVTTSSPEDLSGRQEDWNPGGSPKASLVSC